MKHSIKRQVMVMFMGLVVLIMIIFSLFSGVLLERYYVANKEAEFIKVYDMLDEDIMSGSPISDARKMAVARETEKNNIIFLVVDRQYNPVYTNAKNMNILVNQLWGYLFNKDMTLEKEEGYNLGKSVDSSTNIEYIEMWGQMGPDKLFIMRSPLESIRESVKLFNKFIAVIGTVVLFLSFIVAWYFSKKLTKPLRELAEISQNMTALDFDAKYTSGGDDEIGILGQNFNEMANKLEETISDLKKANVQLQKDIEKKDEVENMRSEFLGNVSHELKTPIALIQGYAEGLKEGIVQDKESREFYCDVIMDEADKMNKMVRELLTLNQLEFGDRDTDFTRFDVTDLIQGVLKSLEIITSQKDVSIRFSGPSVVYVWSDEWKVEQVFRNYFNNALNHVSEQGYIDITVSVKNDIARISVFNTGTPIPEEDVSHIWEKFYKVDKARTREYGGNGIGLSIVKAVMELLGQDYGLKNHENGVEFWFELNCR